jgi:hypothetical protein
MFLYPKICPCFMKADNLAEICRNIDQAFRLESRLLVQGHLIQGLSEKIADSGPDSEMYGSLKNSHRQAESDKNNIALELDQSYNSIYGLAFHQALNMSLEVENVGKGHYQASLRVKGFHDQRYAQALLVGLAKQIDSWHIPYGLRERLNILPIESGEIEVCAKRDAIYLRPEGEGPMRSYCKESKRKVVDGMQLLAETLNRKGFDARLEIIETMAGNFEACYKRLQVYSWQDLASRILFPRD